jgi:hypothetical protein
LHAAHTTAVMISAPAGGLHRRSSISSDGANVCLGYEFVRGRGCWFIVPRDQKKGRCLPKLRGVDYVAYQRALTSPEGSPMQ